MSAENAKLAVRWFEEVWNKQRVEAIDEMFAADGLAHGLAPDGSPMIGPEGFKPFHTTFIGAFPDLNIQVEDVICQGDKTAVRFSGSGTHRGDHLGVAPTGQTVKFTGMSFIRWRNGQIIEGWNNVDMISVLQPIGAL